MKTLLARSVAIRGMSNGDDDSEADESADAATDELAVSLEERLNEAESTLDAAETEAILDEVESTLDDIEADLEAADFPEPDEDAEDAEDPQEALENRLADLRDRLEDERGPYATDVAEIVADAAGTVRDTRWTDDGEPDVVVAVESYLSTATDHLSDSFATESEATDDLAAALEDVAAALEESGLDADDDAETIATLLEDAETLADDLDAAEQWDDLSIQGQLDHEGFYDVLDTENRKDYPPEWSAVKVYEQQNEPEPILLALDRLDSDFMEENILDSLVRMGSPEAFEEMHQRAQKRNKQPVEILGKIGDERALETLHDFVDGDGDPQLQKVTLRAIGEIGSEESTGAVANRLAADNYEVRSAAARALGLIGDTRAIDPLADVLADDEADEVRASAAWALNRIGTERALDVAAEYTDDSAYIVQAEAEKAAGA
jgi:hypothetical protein